MSLKNIDNKVFSHKSLSLLMMAFGSFMVAVGPVYAYFIATEVGLDDMGDALWPFLGGIAGFPAGIYVCIVGRKLKKPIINIEKEDEKEE